MSYETLIVDVQERIALVRLNRPEALNALNSTMMAELAQALTKADLDPDIRCIILTGSDKAFAAGADIKEMSELSFVDAFTRELFGAEADVISAVRKPMIAAVAGFALGGGCELAMMCDFILAADTAKFGQPEINLGIVAGMGGSQRLTRFVGKSKAMEMHLTGRLMDAMEAERAGLVSRVLPAEHLLEETMITARKIAGKSLVTAMAVKEAVNRSYETTMREGILHERRLFNAMFATEDQKEGMAAFLAKRPPNFQDR